MTIKTLRFQQATLPKRTFLIAISATLSGYSARVTELLQSGERVAIAVRNGPRNQVPPAAFYRMRQHYRGELIADVRAQLEYGQADRLDPSEDVSRFDCYTSANLIGWPEGFPEAVDDDMSDWQLTAGV